MEWHVETDPVCAALLWKAANAMRGRGMSLSKAHPPFCSAFVLCRSTLPKGCEICTSGQIRYGQLAGKEQS